MNLRVEVRDAVPGDARALAALHRESAAAHVALDPDFYIVPDHDDALDHARRQVAGEGRVLVAVSEARIVGTARVRPLPEPPRGSMIRPVRGADIGIVVASDHRGRGVGRALMEAAEDRAADDGFEILTLDAHAANQPALRLYESLGYGTFGVRMQKRIG